MRENVILTHAYVPHRLNFFQPVFFAVLIHTVPTFCTDHSHVKKKPKLLLCLVSDGQYLWVRSAENNDDAFVVPDQHHADMVCDLNPEVEGV